MLRQPCDEALAMSVAGAEPCARNVERWVLIATIIGSSIAFIDGTVVNVALPVLQGDLHATVANVQWVVLAYTLLLAALLLPGGALGDRFGRRKIYALGIAIFALSSAACGIAANIGQLVAARAVQGVGAALLVPGSLAIIGASFAPERRGRAIGTWSGFSAVTTAMGPVLGGWLVQHISWRAVFFINVPLAALTLAILFWQVPESRNEDAPPNVDWPGALLAAAGLGSLTYGLNESSNLGLGHPLVLACVFGGIAVLVAFVAVEARIRGPMMPLGLFRSPTFSGANLLTLLLYGALSATFFFLPFNLIQVQGYPPTSAGLTFLPFSALLFLMSRWSGGLVDRFGARRPLVIGSLIAAAGMALFALPGIGGTYWTTFFPAVVVLGLGMSIAIAPLTTAVMGAVDVQHTGTASGINNAASRVAGLLAIAVMGIFMLGTFSAALNTQLAQVHAPPAAASALISQQAQLAAMEIPGDVDPAMRATLQTAINLAFLRGYRTVMLISAAMAAGAAVAAWALVDREKR